MKKNNEYMSLGDAISQFLSKNGLLDEVKIQQLIQDWESLMGKPVATHTEKIWFEKGTLYVKISSSIWRQELSMAHKEIRKIVNESIGKELVREVKIYG
ncbi:MAG: DUF721 domain-containing protein [Bacteroidota bacterium]